MNEKIDIVILWVNDNDKKWTKKKECWQKRNGIVSSTEERYRNWENLQYLFRGIEKYASWVNHVYLVTDDQKPCWLDVSYEKITIVDHKDIIDSEYLPTFNSQAIELNIHKIKGLNNNFIYFNDDTFIIDYLDETDFFKRNIPVDTGIMEVIYPKKINSTQKVIINNLGLINEQFNKRKIILEKPFNWFNLKYKKYNINNLLLLRWPIFTNFMNHHLPVAFNKHTFNKVWTEYSTELNLTTSSKFRADNNYNVWIMRYWQLASNNFMPRDSSLGTTIQLENISDATKCANLIERSKYRLICINDNENTKDFEKSKAIVNKSFEKILHKKSKFEL